MQGVVVVFFYHSDLHLHEYATVQRVWRVTPTQLVNLHQLSLSAGLSASASSASLNSSKQVRRGWLCVCDTWFLYSCIYAVSSLRMHITRT